MDPTRLGKRVWVSLALLLLMVLFLWGVTSLLQQWQGLQEMRRVYATRTAQFGALSATQAALQTQVAQGITTATVETWAYQQGWARPGERPVRPVWGMTPASQAPTWASAQTATPTPVPTPLAPWQVWWGLFFGANTGFSGNP